MNYNKTKVREYLYPTIEAEELLKEINEDVYKLIDTEILISEKNANKEHRKKNYRKLYNLLEDYFNQNYNLYDKLLSAYNVDDIYIDEPMLKYHNLKAYDDECPKLYSDNETITDVIYTLVFDYSPRQEQFKNINIFKNKKSICYDGEPSLYDILLY